MLCSNSQLLSVLVITSGQNLELLSACYNSWKKHFLPGLELFVSGPRELLSDTVDESSIIDYTVDAGSSYGFYLINKKKYSAAKRINAEYIYIVHERIHATGDIKPKLVDILSTSNYDFGYCQVVNSDGSQSVGELYLRDRCKNTTLVEALLVPRERLVAKTRQRNGIIAVNGAAFFIHRRNLSYVDSKFAWGEMEDDVLSFEMQSLKGLYIDELALENVVPKHWNEKKSIFFPIVLSLYLFACYMLELLYSSAKHKSSSTLILSAATRLSSRRLKDLDSCDVVVFLDPLHKRFFTDHYFTSLEKLTTVLRATGNDKFLANICKTSYGWKLGQIDE